MIPKAFITAWRAEAPWAEDAQVEQDLVISRALVSLYTTPGLAERLAFRGGTALYKLHLLPAARYSEDLDFVQIQPEPIGDTLDIIRAALDPWLGEPRRVFKEGRANIIYRFYSEDAPPLQLRLKIEINTREHFSELGLEKIPVTVENPWFSGSAEVTSYPLVELLSTKLRALYQRKRGRDLFDLWLSLDQRESLDVDLLLQCFHRYMDEGGHRVSRAQFEKNLHHKAADPDFRADVPPLLRNDIIWDFDRAMAKVRDQIVTRLPGDAWAGES
jgi:predicted nucleotidyltransferase component of viral defense system